MPKRLPSHRGAKTRILYVHTPHRPSSFGWSSFHPKDEEASRNIPDMRMSCRKGPCAVEIANQCSGLMVEYATQATNAIRTDPLEYIGAATLQ